MDLSNFAVFGLIRKRMGWLTDRQTVLAQNLANADTPNYAAKDLSEPDFKRVLEAYGIGTRKPAAGLAAARAGATAGGPVKLAATNPGHIRPPMPEGRVTPIGAKGGAERSPAGNDVSVEDQVSKVTETQMDYQLTANLYRKHLAMIKSVVRR
jgi:flagellar basal-body rod protein FlgB